MKAQWYIVSKEKRVLRWGMPTPECIKLPNKSAFIWQYSNGEYCY